MEVITVSATGLALTSLEAEVLFALTRTRVTLSSVALAAELWEADVKWSLTLMEQVLDNLSKADLVVYRLGHYDIPVEIRLTKRGWEVAGFPIIHPTAGSRLAHSRDAPMRPGDLTEYRNHPEHAVGVGPCERMSRAEHLDHYPDHRYNKGGF